MGAGTGFGQSSGGGGSTSISSVGSGTSLVVAPSSVKSLIAGTGIGIVDNGNDVTISNTNTFSGYTSVANYSALPDPTLHNAETYEVLASQGTAWLPGSLGGTYYSSGFYYSNGSAWSYLGSAPYQASQSDVNAGTITDQFVSPSTLNNYSGWTGNKVVLSRMGSSTYSTVQHLMNFALSSGLSSGGAVTDAGGATINTAAGTGFLRATDSNVATQSFFDFAATTGTAIPSNSIRYVGVDYNAGSPQILIKTTNVWDLDTQFPLAVVTNEGGTLYIINNPYITADNMTNVIERFDSLSTITRDNRLAGLVLGYTGTRKVTVTAGSLLARMSEFPITAIDTNVSGSFDNYYRDGAGGWTKEATQTQFNITKYDNNSGTLANMTALYFSSRWVYLMTDGTLAILYGQSQSVAFATILAETPPTSVPNRIAQMGLLIGRYIVQTSVNVPSLIQTVFTINFSSANVQNHNDLANIQGGTAGEAYHLTSAEYTGNGTGLPVRTTSPALVTPTLGVASATSETITGTGGAGYTEYPAQSSNPSAPSATGLRVFTGVNGNFNWIKKNGSDVYNRMLTSTNTADRTYTLQDSSDTFVMRATTDTLTNKRLTSRTGTVASSATPTINTDNVDYFSITALAAAITSFTTNLSGTPSTNDTIWISITDNGTARAITWGASFEASGTLALPTTTVISTRLDVGFVWNEVTTKWRICAVN